MKRLLEKLYNQNTLTKEELVYLLQHLDEESMKELFSYSRKLREEKYGKKVYLRGLVEFSNICKQDCLYCGIRKSNKEVERYRLTEDEIIQCCELGYDLGYRTFVLQSGEDSWYTKDKLVNIVKKIKSQFPDVAVTLSLGERDYDTYKELFDAGADRYLLRHETASKRLYEKLHPTMKFENRIKCLAELKEIGYQVGAGFMVGLPDQTVEDLAEDLLFLNHLQPHMIGIGPFIPHHQTPLKNERKGELKDTLIMVALARLLVPDSLIPATTALGSLDYRGREAALEVGANVVMPNLSPMEVRAKYQLYDNKICLGDESASCRWCIENRIKSTGYEVDLSKGDCIRIGENQMNL
ncbi:[FeFe] hydrogenase H-cluster radical SAM maturase HydE [Vulcanibacillus modesticaldus]|uniref:[FeFe] hydrogenase H-cluster radical SAM maturase HydE n=1 Tax=Vulcanibacillus modesticaldus TaxID=337097 RepID=A0A1D2YWW9_9BACI|nr:[FeFe] hydrogenase H-cluster radical SAM maturase HydE [Vulcanibacillus modesticaldus]OEG00219.1 [FeFe] hydrogenase H-cluster radical SAM maturase HydE [Vulcanibacillus modesticaldus]